MTTPPLPPNPGGSDAFRPPPSPAPLTGATDRIPLPPTQRTDGVYRRTAANEETTVLTPVTAATNILDRIPLSERKRWKLLAGSAAGLAVLALGLSAYLWVINDRWQTRADALSAEGYDLGARLSDARAQIVVKQGEIDLLTGQLETAQARMIELADEKAQGDDDVSYSQQQIAKFMDLSSLGGSVSLLLNQCVDLQKNLVGYLKNPGAWNADDLAEYETDVTATCDLAQGANADLQQALTE